MNTGIKSSTVSIPARSKGGKITFKEKPRHLLTDEDVLALMEEEQRELSDIEFTYLRINASHMPIGRYI